MEVSDKLERWLRERRKTTARVERIREFVKFFAKRKYVELAETYKFGEAELTLLTAIYASCRVGGIMVPREAVDACKALLERVGWGDLGESIVAIKGVDVLDWIGGVFAPVGGEAGEKKPDPPDTPNTPNPPTPPAEIGK